MKRLMILFSLISILSVNVLFSAIPDYSGTWILDTSKAEENGQGGQRRGMIAQKITVVLQANTLDTERFMSNPMRGDFSTKEKLTLDGKECVMETEMGPRTSTATWSDEKKAVIIQSQMNMNMGGEDYKINFHETWSLESDGSLKIESKRTSPRGERVSVHYYKKSE